MIDRPTPEPSYRQALGEVFSSYGNLVERLTLVMHDNATGEDLNAPLTNGVWQGLAGKPGVNFYPIPHPDGSPGLFAAFCHIAPGSCGKDGSTPISQTIAMLAGKIHCNNICYVAGQTFYIPPDQASEWCVGEEGYLSAILFDAPTPALAAEVLTSHPSIPPPLHPPGAGVG